MNENTEDVSRGRRTRFLIFLFGGLIGSALGGLLGFLVVGDSLTAWLGAGFTFVTLEVIGMYVLIARGTVDRRSLLRWVGIAAAFVGVASFLFFFFRGALSS